MVQKGGELLDGSAFEEKTVAVYRSREKTIELRELRHKDGEEYLEISSGDWPGFVLRGDLPGGDGSFELSGARILSSHLQGWNEFDLDLLGSAFFEGLNDAGGVLRMAGEVEMVQISSGKIRLKGNYLSGNAALVPLRNRRERIIVLTEWMGEWLHSNSYPAMFMSQKEFEDFWKPRLFPELVPRKKQPAEYSADNAEWGRADSVRWNRSYTKSLLPESLWELRNSGALLRDWEEALHWIFIEYSWDMIINSFNDTALLKTRR